MIAEIAYYRILGSPVVIYIGIITLMLMIVAAAIPLLNRRRITRIPIKWHVWVAFAAIILAVIHGTLIFVSNL